MGYGEWLHGEAVGCGMVLATDLSVRLGLLDAAWLPRLTRLIERGGLPTRAPAMPLARWMSLMRLDKKASAGDIRFVLINGQGRALTRSAPASRRRWILSGWPTGCTTLAATSAMARSNGWKSVCC